MAQGILQSFDGRIEVHSAGTNPADKINQNAVRVLKEIGIDISGNKPKSVDIYLKDDWDYVITVCDEANEICPYFPGNVKHRLHMGVVDPSNIKGDPEFVVNEFRKVRDEMKAEFRNFYETSLKLK